MIPRDGELEIICVTIHRYVGNAYYQTDYSHAAQCRPTAAYRSIQMTKCVCDECIHLFFHVEKKYHNALHAYIKRMRTLIFLPLRILEKIIENYSEARRPN